MLEIHSKINNKLLHGIFRKEDIVEGRTDIAPTNQFIQVCVLDVRKDKTFRPHQHIWKSPKYGKVIAQESWCVISGTVKVSFYDTDGTLITTELLDAGDISMTFEGGHAYEIIEDAIVYEYKTGPYEGQKRDKVFIDE